MVYSSAGSIITAADDFLMPQAEAEEPEAEAEYLGGAAAAFEDSFFDEEQPVLQTAGAISTLDNDLGLFDVWAGGELVDSFENIPADEEEAAETEDEMLPVTEPDPVPTITPTPIPAQAPAPDSAPVPLPEPAVAEAETSTPEPAEVPVEEPSPTAIPEEPTPVEEEPVPEEENGSEEQSEDGAAKGAEVAAFACQFVGNPYVYGGTSLTDGADCSGFVMSVYKNFGVSLPRSSGDFPNAAYAVEDGLAGARPGDIMCYRGHVAIYIGTGQIVHAYNSRKGIAITEVGYDTVIAVRRVFR